MILSDRCPPDHDAWERAVDAMRIPLDLPRRPRPLDRQERARLAMWMADTVETLRRYPALRQLARGIIELVTGDADA